MARTSGAPKKAPNQGSVAPADTQAVNAFNTGPSNTAHLPDSSSNTSHNWQDHAGKSNPGGYGG